MSMKNSGRPRRPCMTRWTMSRPIKGSGAPVDVMTISTAASAVESSSNGTAVPESVRAISWARAQVRLVTLGRELSPPASLASPGVSVATSPSSFAFSW